MKKILSFAFLLALVFGSFALRASAETSPTQTNPVTGACMQTAVDVRETAVIAAVSAHATAFTSALTTRKDALKAAWGMSDRTSRKAALDAAWTAFKTSRHTYRQGYRDSVESAWTAFRTARMACHAPSDGNGWGIDGL